MRKPASLAISVLLATLLAALLMPLSAFADDDNEDSPSSNSKESSKSLTEKQETEEKHKEIEGIYKNPGRISLPPIVIRPVKPNDVVSSPKPTLTPTPNPSVSAASVKNTNGSGSSSSSAGGSSSSTDSPDVVVRKTNQDYVAVSPKVTGSLTTEPNTQINQPATGTSINPVGGAAIDISSMNPEAKTPAETFIEAAYVGLGAMAFGAIALAIAAGTRSIRRK